MTLYTLGVGEDPASARHRYSRRQPEPRRPRSAAILRRRRTNIAEHNGPYVPSSAGHYVHCVSARRGEAYAEDARRL
jgi:hypothetical protein